MDISGVKVMVIFLIPILVLKGGWCQQTEPVGAPPQPEDRNATLEFEKELANQNNASASLPCSTIEVEDGSVTRKNGVIDPRFRWQNFLVYVDPDYSQREHTQVNNAMWRLMTALPGCLNFTIFPYGARQPGSGDFIHIRKGNGCSSWVGKLANRQIMTLQSPGCMSVGTIMHEMVHALGFFHEQSRPDRDEHITATILIRQMETSTFNVSYNLRSIMHYGARDFTSNGQPTIVANNGGEVGSRGELEQTDIDKIKRMYNC